MQNPEHVAEKINEKTKLIWVETPTNPMMNIVDVQAITKLSRNKDILVVVDNTFASPYLQQPLKLGADIVMHSATKYLGGHSDVVLGALVVRDESLAEQLAFIQNASGAVCGPMDAFLVLRGIKTLHVRMQRHCENGKAIAEFLSDHPKVKKVYWPGFENHPNHKVAQTQMKDFAGHPASMTHASIPKEEREKSGVVDGLIRLSVGLEDIDDLIDDLKQAIG